MAVVTLPNGSTWDTDLSYNQQRDNTGSMAFIDTIRADNTVVVNTTTGPDPNLPKPIKPTFIMSPLTFYRVYLFVFY